MNFVSVADFRENAEKVIAKNAFDYYKSGAGDEFTLRLNKTAFENIRIRPRFLRDVSRQTSKCNVLGIDIDMPIGIAPTAMQRMAHPEGEVATAKAAGNANTIFILSTLSTTSIEEIGEQAPNTHKWFQLYIYKDRALSEDAVRRAENNGFKAIVLTVDAPCFGIRRADVRNKFKLPPHLELKNFSNIKDKVKSGGGSGINEYVSRQFDASITWTDVEWLVKFSKLPVILKGILTKEDAELAIKTGCKGIIVSNHGARQLDSVEATIEALPAIVEAVGDKLTVMLDGGISDGTDAFKAIALGAKMVFIGRPAIWGLAADGQQGVEKVLSMLKNEFDIAMVLSGTTTVDQITKEYVLNRGLCKL